MKARRGRPRKAKTDVERIIRAGLRAARKHPEDVSMRALARELKVDPMALYYHVPDKETLMVLLGGRILETMVRRLPRKGDPLAKIQAFALAYAKVCARYPALMQVWASDPGIGAEVAVPATEYLYSELLRAGASREMVVMSADLIVDFLHGRAMAAGRKKDPHRIALRTELDGRTKEFRSIQMVLAHAGVVPLERYVAFIVHSATEASKSRNVKVT